MTCETRRTGEGADGAGGNQRDEGVSLMENLQSYTWQCRYESGLHDLVDDFYVPALSRSVQYDRKAGFFSSGALVLAATGIARLLATGGRMRLLVGVQLNDADTQAIAEGYRQKEQVIEEALKRSWTLTDDQIAQDRLAAMAEMIAQGLLEIRVVAPIDDDGRLLSQDYAGGLFHEKSGIFTDTTGDRVVFVGSINESEAAWSSRNIEHFHVFCSWRADADHASAQVGDFQRLWSGEHPNALTLPFPEALRQELLQLRKDDVPKCDPLEKSAAEARDNAIEIERWLVQFLRDVPRMAGGETIVESFIPIQPWPHQQRVWKAVRDAYPDKWYMLCDEVGLGKTIEAGLILRALMFSGQVHRVLALVPRSLILQWQQELREKFNLWAYWYTGKEYIDPTGKRLEAPENGWDAHWSIIIASTALARRKERLEKLLEARPWDLVLVDEAHHARRPWTPSEGQANQMLQLLNKLRRHTRALQLMTATPMQIDVRELWELLRLCGMEGRWADRTGHDFQQYFLTLQHDPWTRDDLNYLLNMSHEYFATGGQADERLKQQFCEHSNGGHTLWHQLTRSLAPADPADIYSKLQAHDARGMKELMADFFRRHTPVRRYMFRHTRDTLRHYRSQGLLAEKIPVRKVCDRFIPLGPAQEPYDQIEEYISEKYRKAEAEKRSALGYVMTIYRQRLTSSPRAISETLQRRLESNLGQLEERAETLLEVDIDEYIEDFGEVDETQINEAKINETWMDADALQEENRYIRQFLQKLEAIGTDPKLQRLISDLQDMRSRHAQVVIFTQYTDTMDFLREALVETYGQQVACYSGRGGETWDPAKGRWCTEIKDNIKSGFAQGDYEVLICTQAASEGLNLQSSDLLINYDMPWNPTRVEQRIGRIDRIGQLADTVHIINYYYEGSVEAQIYQVLRDRLDLFQTAVGPLQPVLGAVVKRIERAVMAGRAQKQAVMQEECKQLQQDIARSKKLGLNVDELTDTHIESQEHSRPLCQPEDIRDLILTSQAITANWTLEEHVAGVYTLTERKTDALKTTTVTFRQDILEARPEEVHHCLAWGDPIFAQLLAHVPAPAESRRGDVERISQNGGATVEYVRHEGDTCRRIKSLRELQEALSQCCKER
jgi:ERCC4-related helicase